VDCGQIVKVYVHDAGQHPERKYSAVLKILPVVSPETAVRAAIVQEFRLAE
jgi:hypothetical protein